MAKEIIERRASDNAYLHKDFHGALSAGLIYLEERFGAEAVREYLAVFAATYYRNVTEAIKERGLGALKRHLENLYRVEGGQVTITGDDDQLLLEVATCPAVTHMRAHEYAVSPLFYETSKTVYETICSGTPFAAEWKRYEPETGQMAVRFTRRAP